MNYDETSLKAAHLVVAAIARRHGVNIVYGNYRTAMTDYNTIYLPNLPINCSEKMETLLWGFINHEAGHIAHTDPESLPYVLKQNDTFLTHIQRALEDVYMEMKHIEQWPGASKDLAKTCEVLVDERVLFNSPTSDLSPGKLVCFYALLYLRNGILNQTAVQPILSAWREALQKEISAGFVIRLNSQLDRIVSCKDSWDVIDLSMEIRQFMEDEKDEEEPDQEEPTPPADNVDDASDEDLSPSNNLPSTGNCPGDDEDFEDETTQGNNNSLNSNGSNKADKKEFIQKALDMDISELGDQSLDLGDAVKDLLSDGLKKESARPVKFLTPENSVRSGSNPEMNLIAETASAGLGTQLKRLFESVKNKKEAMKTRGKRINPRFLSRVAMNDYRIFDSKKRQPALNTSVILLLDYSSSMNDVPERMKIASQSVLAASMSIDQIQDVSCMAVGFGSSSLLILKRFNEKAKAISSRFDLAPTGGTPMAEALLWSANELVIKAKKDQRQIIIVATDGDPDCGPSTDAVISELINLGIEVYGIGIQTSAVDKHFTNFCVVNDIGQLTDGYMKMFSCALLRRTA